MKKASLILLAILAWGCSSPPPPATPQTFSTYNTQANHEKQISLEGYLRFPAAALVSDTMILDLAESLEPKAKVASVSTKVGSSANQVEKPPKDYTDKDLKVHANDGSLVELNQKVRVSGKLIYSASGGSILFAPVDIQKI
ncbi:hypothetical protein JST97_10180 [bacterium]|nr:hypothetical protein [bacterium]